MQLGHETAFAGLWLYEQLKYWLPALGILWGAFKTFRWVKEIREKDLADLKISVEGLKTGITDTKSAVEKMEEGVGTKIENQTISIVDQLKELRSDFRTFYTIPQPQMIPARAKPVPVKKPVKSTKQKSKSKSK